MHSSTAFLFPGQGSQYVGMLADLIRRETVVADTLSEASDAIDLDLRTLILTGPAAELGITCNTQPALLACSLALWRLWQHRDGETPAFVAGHSLGEYSALVAAGALPFAEAVALVRQRGLFMQEAAPLGDAGGGMLAVLGLSDEEVRATCAGVVQDGEVLSAANLNAPGQVVVSGSRSALERSTGAFREAGARKVMPLPVSIPSHCRLMEPACARLERALEATSLSQPLIPLVQNTTATVTDTVDKIRTQLVCQLSQPVLWTDSIRYMAQQGVTHFVECGPGRVLAGLNKRILGTAATGLDTPEAFPERTPEKFC